MNNSLERAHRSVEEGARALMHLVEETRGHVKKQLDSAYVQEVAGRLAQTVEFAERLVKYATPTGVLVFKRLLDARLQKFLSFNLDISRFLRVEYPFEQPPLDTDFAHQQIMTLMGLTVGANNSSPAAVSFLTAELPPTPIGRQPSHRPLNGAYGGGPISSNYSDSNLLKLKHEFGRRTQSMDNFAAAVDTPANRYQKWSMGLEPSSATELVDSPGLDPASKFTEPSGVAVNAYNEIVVADTNNHCGGESHDRRFCDSRALSNPSDPYDHCGQFTRRFDANVLEHPRGICVDNKGRIIVVECKVTRVAIFDMFGNLLQKFSCFRHLDFPNGVCTNDREEIFISDNRAHCVKVFSYSGEFVREIGGEGITNYPIGVGLNSAGDVLIADNHNNFNLTLFTQEGAMLSALESRVKHAQCFDMAVMDEGCLVLASKDYRLYLYRYSPD
ncbi:B-box type zinc finger protein ncl-1 [Toxocara canis]|uniref:B-box type zinc finger protein ncl-1 n=1 Tax=Toxocara canis TaxID=6265 RepID=A0A0B2VS92_TOXCA|nr:B-box type zinc finger protein ncl-1 [Toxocara canis]